MELCAGVYPVTKGKQKGSYAWFLQYVGIRYFEIIIQWLSQSFFAVMMDSLSLLPFIVFTVTLQFQLIRNHAGMGWSNLLFSLNQILEIEQNYFSTLYPVFSHSFSSFFFFFLFIFFKIGSITPNRTWLWKDYSRSTEIALSCHFD